MTTTEVKQFGGRERPKAEQFDLTTFLDDGGSRTHRFNLVPIIPAGHVTGLMDALDDESEKTFGLIARLLTRVLDNTDGVSASWTYTEFQDPAPGDVGYDQDGPEVFFVGPDNEVHSAEDATARDKFQSFDAGSSRRRWAHLMDPENLDEAVDLADMVDIAKWVVGLSVDRPTQARASSTKGSRKTKR